MGANCPLGDSDLLVLRDQLTALAGAAVRAYRTAKQAGTVIHKMSASSRADVEERAAILEFDAGIPRVHAEQIALAGASRVGRQ